MKSPLRRIMVPLDRSASAQQALRMTMVMAPREGAEVGLVIVAPPVSSFPGDLADGVRIAWGSGTPREPKTLPRRPGRLMSSGGRVNSLELLVLEAQWRQHLLSAPHPRASTLS